jgi:hypothetical protein
MGNYTDFNKARDYVSPTLLNGITKKDTAAGWLNKVIHNIYEKFSVTSHQIYTLITEFKWVNEKTIQNDLSLRIKELNDYVVRVKKGEAPEVQDIQDFNTWVADIRETCNVLNIKGKEETTKNISTELKELEKTAKKFQKKLEKLHETKSKIESLVQDKKISAEQINDQGAAAEKHELKGNILLVAENDSENKILEEKESPQKELAQENPDESDDFYKTFNLSMQNEEIKDPSEFNLLIEEEEISEKNEQKNENKELTEPKLDSTDNLDDKEEFVTTVEKEKMSKTHEISLASSSDNYSPWYIVAASIGGIAIGTLITSFLRSEAQPSLITVDNANTHITRNLDSVEIVGNPSSVEDHIKKFSDLSTLKLENIEKGHEISDLQNQVKSLSQKAVLFSNPEELKKLFDDYLNANQHDILLGLLKEMVNEAIKNPKSSKFLVDAAKEVFTKYFSNLPSDQVSEQLQKDFFSLYYRLVTEQKTLIYSDNLSDNSLQIHSLVTNFGNIAPMNTYELRKIFIYLTPKEIEPFINNHHKVELSPEHNKFLAELIISKFVVGMGRYDLAINKINDLIQQKQSAESIEYLASETLHLASLDAKINIKPIIDTSLGAASFLILNKEPEKGFKLLNQISQHAKPDINFVKNILKNADITPSTDFTELFKLKANYENNWSEIGNAILDNIETKKLSTSQTCETINNLLKDGTVVIDLNKLNRILASTNFDASAIDSKIFQEFLSNVNRININFEQKITTTLFKRVAEASNKQLTETLLNYNALLKDLTSLQFETNELTEIFKSTTISLPQVKLTDVKEFHKFRTKLQELNSNQADLNSLITPIFNKIENEIKSSKDALGFLHSIDYFSNLVGGLTDLSEQQKIQANNIVVLIFKNAHIRTVDSEISFTIPEAPLRTLPNNLLKAKAYSAFLRYQEGCHQTEWINRKEQLIKNFQIFTNHVTTIPKGTSPSSISSLNEKQLQFTALAFGNIIGNMNMNVEEFESLTDSASKLIEAFPKISFNLSKEKLALIATTEENLEVCKALGEYLYSTKNEQNQIDYINALYRVEPSFISQVISSPNLSRKKLALDLAVKLTSSSTFTISETSSIYDIIRNAKEIQDADTFPKVVQIVINILEKLPKKKLEEGSNAEILIADFKEYLDLGVHPWITRYDNSYYIFQTRRAEAIESYLSLTAIFQKFQIPVNRNSLLKILEETEYSLKTMEFINKIVNTISNKTPFYKALTEKIKNRYYRLGQSFANLDVKPNELFRAISLLKTNSLGLDKYDTTGKLLIEKFALKNNDEFTDVDKCNAYFELLNADYFTSLVKEKVSELFKPYQELTTYAALQDNIAEKERLLIEGDKKLLELEKLIQHFDTKQNKNEKENMLYIKKKTEDSIKEINADNKRLKDLLQGWQELKTNLLKINPEEQKWAKDPTIEKLILKAREIE